MTVIKNLDEKYTKVNNSLKQEMVELKNKVGTIGS